LSPGKICGAALTGAKRARFNAVGWLIIRYLQGRINRRFSAVFNAAQ
jgi:hypothetical protein